MRFKSFLKPVPISKFDQFPTSSLLLRDSGRYPYQQCSVTLSDRGVVDVACKDYNERLKTIRTAELMRNQLMQVITIVISEMINVCIWNLNYVPNNDFQQDYHSMKE